MSDKIVTTLPPDARANKLTFVRLDVIPLGTTVEIVTESGATYWVTPVVGRRLISEKIYGLQINTNSGTTERFARSPLEVRANALIMVGRPWKLGAGDNGHTSAVVSLKYLGS